MLADCSYGGTSIGPTSNNLTSVLNPWNVLHHAGGEHTCDRHRSTHRLMVGSRHLSLMFRLLHM